jgi:hypothetical protein
LKNPNDHKQAPRKYIGEIKRKIRNAFMSVLASQLPALANLTNGINVISAG